jgi:tRNA threonylcarbamoyladenosine biosynthesis protein TsaE
VLLNIYDSARLKVFHLDAYRVRGADDFESIGFSELLEQRGVVVVEWADRVTSLLPSGVIHVTITTVDQTHREIEIVNGRRSPS